MICQHQVAAPLRPLFPSRISKYEPTEGWNVRVHLPLMIWLYAIVRDECMFGIGVSGNSVQYLE